MGVIIDGIERKSVAEQVEENSKYKGKLVKFNVSKELRIYKKDIPCFVRIILVDIVDLPVEICKGNGQVIERFEENMERKIVDYIIMNPSADGARIYRANGNSYTYNWSAYGENDLVLSIDGGYTNYCMVIPLKYV